MHRGDRPSCASASPATADLRRSALEVDFDASRWSYVMLLSIRDRTTADGGGCHTANVLGQRLWPPGPVEVRR